MTKILGISGGKGVGKSTLASRIRAIVGEDNCFIYALADPLKEDCGYLYNIPDEVLYGSSYMRDTWIHPVSGKSARELLQKAGKAVTDTRPHYYWDRMKERIDKCGTRLIIIPDVRRTIEVEAIREAGGIIYHIYPAYTRAEDSIESELDRRKEGWADSHGFYHDTDPAYSYINLCNLAHLDYMKEFLV